MSRTKQRNDGIKIFLIHTTHNTDTDTKTHTHTHTKKKKKKKR